MQNLIGRLSNDGELHKLLTEERMRTDVHRRNYAQLKLEYMKYYNKSLVNHC